MAAKERKSAITKHLNKDNQLDKSIESINLRRGRKCPSSLLSDNKSPMELKSPSTVKKKKKESSQDGRTTPITRKRRCALDAEEEQETAKTPPPTGPKLKKAFLEKELEDILENATGRNTPSTPRSRKTNEREEDCGEADKLARTRRGGSDVSDIMDEKSAFLLSKVKKSNEKDVDDDNISVRSFSTLLRARKPLDKEIDDDMLSVRSMSMKSKKSEVNNDDTASVASLPRPNLLKKGSQKKKAVPVVKKTIFIKRGRPKKGSCDTKSKVANKKKCPKKAVDDLVEIKETRRILNKSLKYDNKIGGQRRLRSAMLIKKQKLKKTKFGADEKQSDKQQQQQQTNPRSLLIPVNVGEAGVISDGDQAKERLRLDSHNASVDLTKFGSPPEVDGKSVSCKRKQIKKDSGKKGETKPMYFFPDGETPQKSNADKMSQKAKQTKLKMARKLSNESKKRKCVSGIHFETTSSPDDSSVIIVQPRIGPRMKYARLKQIYLKSNALNKPGKKVKAKEIVPKNVLPMTGTATAANFNQVDGRYSVQSIPNFKLVATNSATRNYNTNAAVSFDKSNNLPHIDEPERAFAPKMSPNDIIVTPSGIVLSNSGIISPGSTHPSNVCVNGPNSRYEPYAGGILYPQNAVENVPEMFRQKSPNSISTTAILLERPEANGVLTDSNGTGDVKATVQTEKSPKVDLYRNLPSLNSLPQIPVAKNVNELLKMKSKMTNGNHIDKTEQRENGVVFGRRSEGKQSTKHTSKRSKRTLRNVRQNHSSVSELTYSEPENSCFETDEQTLYKTISCERLNRSASAEECTTKVLLQLGSEPMPLSEALAPFETASAILLNNNDSIDRKLRMDCDLKESPTRGAIEVCSFSKENEEALRELGLDSDLDQTKSEVETTPVKAGDDPDLKSESTEFTKKEKIKEEVDNVLKEMPNRKIPNLLRKPECFNLTKNKIEMKNPLVLKNNDYLTKSPSKPPTVIDKLLERNKSLKKAEQESRYQKSVRNLSENLDGYEKCEIKHKRSLREVRSKKNSKGEQRRLVANKRFLSTNSGCKVYERRGSNPELYSNNYLTAETKVSNENVPLRRALDMCENRDKYKRRGSIDFESLQRVMIRRNSVPDGNDVKYPGNVDDENLMKTDNIKTVVVGTEVRPRSKSHGSETQPRVINIITEDDGSKKGQNLMEEIGIEIGKESIYMNGEKNGRRGSVDSYNSESESLKKLMDGITGTERDHKLTKEVPYSGEKSLLRVEKIRLSIDRKVGEDRCEDKGTVIEESPEDLVEKETILSALGLQRAASQNAQKKDSSCQLDNANYTGTLKTVIKIHRQEKKGNSKAPMKMIYKASSSSSSMGGAVDDHTNLDQEVEAASKAITEEESKNGNGKAKSLVIPEKASSFSIHPGRMCSDVCTYCFGKFGLLDTPCHIAQLKDAHKRRKILATETHLLADSCLCDACFRHVDKKSNCPTFTERKDGAKRKYTMRKQYCCARNCNADSQHNVRRKWFVKLKRSIGRKIVLDPAKLEKLQPAHLVTLCHRHFYWIDYFMSCGICKKRLASVQMYRVGQEVTDLNAVLSADGIPTILTDKRYLCKICHCYASIRLKCRDPRAMTYNQGQFYETCRRRILQCHEIELPDSESESRAGHKKRPKKPTRPTATVTNEGSKSDNETEVFDDIDKGNECEKDSDMKEISHMNIPPKANGNLDFGGVSIPPSSTEVNPTQIHVKLGNLNIGALGNLNIGQDVRHGSRPSDIQCFPTEAELALRAHFDLQPSAEDESAKTGRKGFEKCTTTIQFNPETKNLFYSLQMPYGNHSSFFRHLILLEKYFRSGDLVVSRNADPKAVNYISSVQNRIRSYEGLHSPIKKDMTPSLSILPQPVIKTEARSAQEIQSSVIQSRPFTLTPMPSNASQGFPKNSPLSHMQATVQNIAGPANSAQNHGFIGSLLKSMQSRATTNHPKPEVSITSVPPSEPPPPPLVRIGKNSTQSASALTTKIQENLRNLASKSQSSKQPPSQARAVILNRTVGGQKQSLVQVTTGGKTIHLTLYQFRRIQQMQMRKKQYLEHQAKALKMKEDSMTRKPGLPDDSFDMKNLSPELEIQEIKPSTNGSEMFPLISEVRSLAGDDNGWDKSAADDSGSGDAFPKIPKTLSVSVTKIPSSDYSKEQSVDPGE